MNSPPSEQSGDSRSAESTGARHRRRRWVVLAVLGVLIFHVPLLRAFGHLFTVSEPFEHCGAVVILSGDHRYDVAADLFHQHRVDGVWLIPDEPNYLEVRGILPPAVDVATEHLTRLGIPSELVVRLDDRTSRLVDTARIIGSRLEDAPKTDVLLVCSALDGRRVRRTFDDVLGEPLSRRVYVLGVPYDDFKIASWWRSRTGLKHVFSQICLTGFELAIGDEEEVAEMPDPDAWEDQLQIELAGATCREE